MSPACVALKEGKCRPDPIHFSTRYLPTKSSRTAEKVSRKSFKVCRPRAMKKHCLLGLSPDAA